jgi:hypothetical protein
VRAFSRSRDAPGEQFLGAVIEVSGGKVVPLSVVPLKDRPMPPKRLFRRHSVVETIVGDWNCAGRTVLGISLASLIPDSGWNCEWNGYRHRDYG